MLKISHVNNTITLINKNSLEDYSYTSVIAKKEHNKYSYCTSSFNVQDLFLLILSKLYDTVACLLCFLAVTCIT